MKKVIIADDEAAGRILINQYIKEYTSCVVVAEASNGIDALAAIRKFSPDLVFLDVQMPGLNGFEVLKNLDQLPQIIFSTAFDDYALAAFEVHAVDYLLKPYTKARFAKAMERLPVTDTKPLISLVESINEKDYPERIFIEYAGKITGLNTREIIWVAAKKDYSNVHTAERTYLSMFGISDLESRLNPAMFIRVHRSAIVNVNFIKELDKDSNGYIITLANEKQVRVSRTFTANIKNLLA